MFENLIPHLRLVGLPKRAIVGTDEDLGGNGLRLRDVGCDSSGRLGDRDGRLLGLLKDHATSSSRFPKRQSNDD